MESITVNYVESLLMLRIMSLFPFKTNWLGKIQGVCNSVDLVFQHFLVKMRRLIFRKLSLPIALLMLLDSNCHQPHPAWIEVIMIGGEAHQHLGPHSCLKRIACMDSSLAETELSDITLAQCIYLRQLPN